MTGLEELEKAIRPFLVMEVMEQAFKMEAAGQDVAHLEVGVPGEEPPDIIKQALTDALWQQRTNYAPSLGILELRQAISRYYFERYTVDIDPGRIIVTSGTSPALLLALAAAVPTEGEVLLSNPYYACYPNHLHLLSIKPRFFALDPAQGFGYNAAFVAKHCTQKTAAILINSPGNPTGMVLGPKDLAQIARIGPVVISDEVYHGLVYGTKEHTILEYTDDAFVTNGFSKLYAMTGWRLGYLIAPERYVRVIQKLQQSLFISANTFVQRAAIVALNDCAQYREEVRLKYDQKRRNMLDGLRSLGLPIHAEPQGAFYVLADARALSHDSAALANDILNKAHVGVTPGIDFGSRAEGFLRFSYAGSLTEIDTGLRRLKKYFANFQGL